jgi:hypothetical protein
MAYLTDIAYAIGQMLDGKMHQTTVRFGPDLWQAMERECARLGVSAAQYLREAALARLAYTGGRAGFPAYELALTTAGAGGDVAESLVESVYREPGGSSGPTTVWAAAGAVETMTDSSAVIAQSRQARAQAREVRRHSAELRTAERVRH